MNRENPFDHNGDVHAPGEFGFDMTNPSDVKDWDYVTERVPLIFTKPVHRMGMNPLANSLSAESIIKTTETSGQ